MITREETETNKPTCVSTPDSGDLTTQTFEEAIKLLEASNRVPTRLPSSWNRFPLKIFKTIETLILRAHELIFRDQRRINNSTINALKLINSLFQETSRLKVQLNCLYSKTLWQRDSLQEPVHQSHFNNSTPTSNSERTLLLDKLYVDFEDKFRGSRSQVKERLEVYLPIVANALLRTQNLPILDIGCGRGEWLELLSESGYKAKGLDLNPLMVLECQSKGFEVVEKEAIQYLSTLPDASVGVVSGFHIIEHLSFDDLIRLFDDSLRVLHPGGVCIFETPNPRNLIVASNLFYLDPTHRNPLPSEAMKFFAEERGYRNVDILFLHPSLDKNNQEIMNLPPILKDLLYGPGDYALVAQKPKQ